MAKKQTCSGLQRPLDQIVFIFCKPIHRAKSTQQILHFAPRNTNVVYSCDPKYISYKTLLQQ